MTLESTMDNAEYPNLPRVRRGCLIYQAPAPVKVKANNGEALLDTGDTITLAFNEERPEGLVLTFDWNVEPGTFADRYKTNRGLGGEVDVWYERGAAA